MCRAIPPLPSTPSWRGAQLKKSTGTTSRVRSTFIKIVPFQILLLQVLLAAWGFIRETKGFFELVSRATILISFSRNPETGRPAKQASYLAQTSKIFSF
jgi:hypothetical protein